MIPWDMELVLHVFSQNADPSSLHRWNQGQKCKSFVTVSANVFRTVYIIYDLWSFRDVSDLPLLFTNRFKLRVYKMESVVYWTGMVIASKVLFGFVSAKRNGKSPALVFANEFIAICRSLP